MSSVCAKPGGSLIATISQFAALTRLFAHQGTVFDYFVDEASGSMISWETKVQGFQYMPDSFSNLFVPTVETTRLTYFLNSLMENKHYVMFVGNTGEASQ